MFLPVYNMMIDSVHRTNGYKYLKGEEKDMTTDEEAPLVVSVCANHTPVPLSLTPEPIFVFLVIAVREGIVVLNRLRLRRRRRWGWLRTLHRCVCECVHGTFHSDV